LLISKCQTTLSHLPSNLEHDIISIMTIQILATGGTFEKEYNEITGKLFFTDTHLTEMLKMGRSRIDVDIKKLMLKDSFNLSDKDRKLIVQSCINSTSDRILITHGTDTMVQTATEIAKKVKNKTIILTGAMIPYKFGGSDGLFNLGSSLAFLQALPKGVYISMNGQYFQWNNVIKNTELGRFEELN